MSRASASLLRKVSAPQLCGEAWKSEAEVLIGLVVNDVGFPSNFKNEAEV